MTDRNQLLKRIQELSRPLEPEPTGEAARLPARMGSLHALIFDFYGTMFVSASGDIDPENEQSAALIEAMEAAGMPLQDPSMAPLCLKDYTAAILQTHAALKHAGIEHPEVDVRDIWSRLSKDWKKAGRWKGPYSPDLPERLAVEYECRVNPVWPMPGLLETLDALKQQGVCLGILSNAQFYTPLLFEALTGRTLKAAGFDSKLMIWSYREREAKPGRRLFEKMAEACNRAYGLPPERIGYVGNDMLKDIAGAHAVGMKTILFAGDRRSLRRRKDHPLCRALEPDGIVTDLRELAKRRNAKGGADAGKASLEAGDRCRVYS